MGRNIRRDWDIGSRLVDCLEPWAKDCERGDFYGEHDGIEDESGDKGSGTSALGLICIGRPGGKAGEQVLGEEC
jgi:hypothetical protein